jgi:hypothetical protein
VVCSQRLSVGTAAVARGFGWGRWRGVDGVDGQRRWRSGTRGSGVTYAERWRSGEAVKAMAEEG